MGVTRRKEVKLTAACVAANLCRERSRLPRCSSDCGGKSPGIQVTGWCPSYPGCNLRTVLPGKRHWEMSRKKQRGKEPKINNAASERGEICLLINTHALIDEWKGKQ